MAVTEFLLETLTAGARRLAPFIPGLVEAGKTLDEIQDIAKSLVGGARRTDIATLIRAVKEIESSRDYLKSVRKDRKPDPARLPGALSKTLRTYSFKVQLRGTSAETGEEITRGVTISTSELLSVGEMEQRALAMVEELEAVRPGYGELFESEDIQAVVTTGTRRE